MSPRKHRSWHGIKRESGKRLMDENACYRASRDLKECAIYRVVNPVWAIHMPEVPGAWEFGAGYFPFTGQMELFELETGERICGMSRRHFDILIRQHQVAILSDTPCVPEEPLAVTG